MGKLYLAKLADGTERTVASPSMRHAKLFYDLAMVAEKLLEMPSGVAADNGQDEHIIEAEQFMRFFDRFWQEGWLGEKRGGLLYAWAQEAAGMIENITLTSQDWVDRNGEKLEVKRFLRWEEFVERQRAKGIHIPNPPGRPPQGAV